jgi:tryptophanyl-tRNA synthetase
MSASDVNSSIYMSDTPAQIKNKVNKHGFSGGKETEEEHRMYGGDTEVDVSYQYLTFFLDDDEELKTMGEVSRFRYILLIGSDYVTLLQDYRAGRLLTGQLKAKCIQLLQNFVKDFQEVRIRSCIRYRLLICSFAAKSKGHGR